MVYHNKVQTFFKTVEGGIPHYGERFTPQTLAVFFKEKGVDCREVELPIEVRGEYVRPSGWGPWKKKGGWKKTTFMAPGVHVPGVGKFFFTTLWVNWKREVGKSEVKYCPERVVFNLFTPENPLTASMENFLLSHFEGVEVAFPEPLAELPVPQWVVAYGSCDCGHYIPQCSAVGMVCFRSDAEAMISAFRAALDAAPR